jgi:hypothetical protein
MAERLTIFVGSSTEQLPIAESCATIIERANHTAIGWWNDGVFPAGRSLMPVLRELAHSVDGAIFFFAEDDKVWFRDEELGQPRDNVLIEYGLFMGSISDNSPERVVFCRVGSAKTASDVAGVLYIPYDANMKNAFATNIKNWLGRLTPAKRQDAAGPEEDSQVFSSKTKEELFRAGESIVRGAANKIILCAKTPVPIVGTRPYDDSDEPEQYEIDQLDAYDKFLKRVSTDNNTRFAITACLGSIREDLHEVKSKAFSNRVRQRIGDLYKTAQSSDGRLQLRWYEGTGITTFVADEAHSIIWFKRNNHENVWFATRGPKIVSTLREHNNRLSKVMKLESVLAKLNLS